MITIDGSSWNYKDVLLIQLIRDECLENGRRNSRRKMISRDLERENVLVLVINEGEI